MERHAPPEKENEDAASGTRIHAVLALLASADTLSFDEAETCEMCASQANEVIREWADCNLFAAPEKTIREQRIGMTAIGSVIDVTPDSRADFIFTGQADLILVKDGSALVIDYKTGRGDTPVAKDNPQLAALAVLVRWRYRVSNVRVAIVQPWAGKPTIADYGDNALTLAHGWLMDTLQRAAKSTPDDARAGEWCKYCKAQAACPAYRAATLQQIEIIQPMSIAGMDDEGQRKAMFARAMDLPAESLAGAVRGLGMVERYVSAIKGAARLRAEEDEAFKKFYVLREKRGKRSITDVQTVAHRAFAHGVTVDDFTAACDISLKSTKELLHKATAAKGKALDAMLDEVIEGAHEVGSAVKELTAVDGEEVE